MPSGRSADLQRPDLDRPGIGSLYSDHIPQRPAEAFEKCVELLLDAGAPIIELEETHELVPTAVFTRNPGGNPKVIEMLVAAGADPNPHLDTNDSKRLSDVIKAAFDLDVK